jgi:HK97 family phage major capsid protein
VRVTGRARPTAYILNPTEWETIDLLQDNEGRYFFGGPSVLGTPRLWGLPVVESEAMTAGVGVVGDMRQCVLWDREAASIMASDSHMDFFTRNMVAILAELRAAFGIFRPAAIVEMDLTA